MSIKSKQSSKKSSGGKKKKKIEDSDEDFESSEEELDLTKECHPIGYYIHDKGEMINQMFSVIKGNKLKAMLPPILKEYDIEQLKLQCLDQLLGMSEKRIRYLLEGETLDTSSESEIIESDECDSDEKNVSSSSNSDRSNDTLDDVHEKNAESMHKKRKGSYSNEGKCGKKSKLESEPPEQGKTLLEILELEMRARAIRALLKQSGNEKENDLVAEEEPKTEKNGVKDISEEVVDLTECEDEEFSARVKKECGENNASDISMLNLEEKTEKSMTEKPDVQESEKMKKLKAELELRNKLFKKKIYRSRQQRMENEEEDRNVDVNEFEVNNPSGSKGISIKHEPVEPVEIIIEDPEEGEISTSDDEHSVVVKKELPETPEAKDDFEEKIDNDLVEVTTTDNEMLLNNNTEDVVTEQGDGISVDNQNQAQEIKCRNEEDNSDSVLEETSWRDRWFLKDGVQKLVKSSKIYAKVKKRIAEKSQKAKEEIATLYDNNSDSNSNSKPEKIVGSIEEYERLLGRNQVEKKEHSAKNENSLLPASSEVITSETLENEEVHKENLM